MSDKFPPAHLRAHLDSRFSFISEDSFSSEDHAKNVEIASPANPRQAMVASEDWYQKPLVVVVVGASGDLAKKKTYPSLFELFQHNLLPPDTVIWGYARSPKTHYELRDHLHPYLTGCQIPHAPPSKSVSAFLELCFYHHGSSYADEVAYTKLVHEVLATRPFDLKTTNVLYYLAIPPDVFHETVHTLERVPNAVSPTNTKFIIEKPFGRDLATCLELLESFQGLHESMLYRIDHYLGKPMVDNVFTLRSANPFLEHMWNRDHVESIHIRLKEPFGTQGRGGYFDSIGVVRDVVQNHLLQVLLLIAMELPIMENTSDKDENNSEKIREAKVKVLDHMPAIKLEDVLLGQYIGYTDDPTIKNKDTNCPTYAAMRCLVNSPRWTEVPFIIEAGKALDDRLVDVQIQFKSRFPFPSNILTIKIQPEATISMNLHMKPLDNLASPTAGDLKSQAVVTTTMTAEYPTASMGNEPSSGTATQPIENAYTRLLLDCLRGNQTNFCREDELVKSWELFTPLLHQIERNQIPAVKYTQGTDGPSSRSVFLEDMMKPSKVHSSL